MKTKQILKLIMLIGFISVSMPSFSYEFRKSIKGGYNEKSLGEKVAYAKTFNQQIVPFSIIVGDLLIDYNEEYIYISRKAGHLKDVYRVEKKIKLKKPGAYGPFGFYEKIKNTKKAQGQDGVYINFSKQNEVNVIIRVGGEENSYIFRPTLDLL